MQAGSHNLLRILPAICVATKRTTGKDTSGAKLSAIWYTAYRTNKVELRRQAHGLYRDPTHHLDPVIRTPPNSHLCPE